MTNSSATPLSPLQIAIAENEQIVAEAHARMRAANETLAESNRDFMEMIELVQTYVPDLEPEMFAQAHALSVSIEELATSPDLPDNSIATAPLKSATAEASAPAEPKPVRKRPQRNLA
ncbi:hypothetical protein QS306_09130 [Paraburkholderia bonniea]|uniref:hypothetical protein n=1 Tax=Paraburkholderia bonniea TaxID=2152891 RepID=UPI0012925BA6|nr:hypothetical protein [Paraburkholderia bonniea]WJF89285.1 hypothetical protein QS306_09130 [Paraburkholderia bonniea]WJF92601.1 hypothetical protein QS308_09140 [Paraburkholderia bonniea]